MAGSDERLRAAQRGGDLLKYQKRGYDDQHRSRARAQKFPEKKPGLRKAQSGLDELFLILREELLAHGVEARLLIVTKRIVEIRQRGLHGADRSEHGF
jgi:hypothetical protein